MSKVSQKFLMLGLRRDKNLNDVASPVAALGELLNNLVDEENKTFLAEDLDAIQGIQNTNITSSMLSELAGITVRSSVLEEVNGETITVNEVVTPIIRLNDRVENSKNFTGSIPPIQGGNGLVARFIPSTDINPGNKTSTGESIFNFNQSQTTEVFWDAGFFNFPTIIDQSFEDQYGGIQWEGYFTPSLKDPNVNITIFTTGLLIFELDEFDNGNWETLTSIYNDQRVIDVIETGGPFTTLTLAENEIKYVAIGDFLDIENEISIVNIDSTTNQILLSAEVFVNNNQITVSKIIGDTTTRSNITLPPQEPGVQVKIRISFWFPDNDETVLEKILDIDYISSNLRFTSLYSQKPLETLNELEIRQFLIDALSPFQNQIGKSGNNKNLYVNNTLFLNYDPSDKNSLSSIRKAGPTTISFSENKNIVTGSFGNAEIGNIIVPNMVADVSNFNQTINLKDSISSSVKIINQNIGTTNAFSVNFLDHKGFVDWMVASSSNLNVTLEAPFNTNSLSENNLVITSSSSEYIKIDKIISSIEFTTTSPLNLSNNEIIYVYGDKGLSDQSKNVFCNGVFGKIVQQTSQQGSFQLTVENNDGIETGQFVQYENSISSNTAVTNVNGNTITLSNALVNTLLESSTVVFVPASKGGEINREGCIVPLDTSPPFIGTSTGLRTANRGIRTETFINSFSVSVDQINSTVDTANISTFTYNNSSQFNKKIPIKAKLSNNLANFSILGSNN
jgi:hypothetical protein